MLTEEKNQLLTRVGPGTPMGSLLRRYWMPIAGVSEFESCHTKAIRLMGEDLVLYKDLSGNFGLIDRHCPHRRADMSFGMAEQNGLQGVARMSTTTARLTQVRFKRQSILMEMGLQITGIRIQIMMEF